MLRLVISICLLGVAGLVIVGGCTPEADRTWSESTDFSTFVDPNISSVYAVTSTLDDRFTTMTLYQSGSTLQGFDNMRRTWHGSMNANAQVHLETSDGPDGREVIVGMHEIYMGTNIAIHGQHYASPKTGYITMIGREKSEEEEEEE